MMHSASISIYGIYICEDVNICDDDAEQRSRGDERRRGITRQKKSVYDGKIRSEPGCCCLAQTQIMYKLLCSVYLLLLVFVEQPREMMIRRHETNTVCVYAQLQWFASLSVARGRRTTFTFSFDSAHHIQQDEENIVADEKK